MKTWVPVVSIEAVASRVSEYFNRISQLFKAKGEEYTHNNDRLMNFRDGMHLTGLPADVYLLSLMAKHVVWLYTEAKRSEKPDKAKFREHAQDVILYLILLDLLYYADEEGHGDAKQS